MRTVNVVVGIDVYRCPTCGAPVCEHTWSGDTGPLACEVHARGWVYDDCFELDFCEIVAGGWIGSDLDLTLGERRELEDMVAEEACLF